MHKSHRFFYKKVLTDDIKFDRMGITKNIDKEMYVKMKSRKLRTVLATLSAIAVLATAMTGFAATVTTTTEYHANSDYAHVISTVTGANGEVTYLATTTDGMGVNSSGILYIDQKTAEGASISFDYMVAKNVIDGINTEIVLGTNGTEAIDPQADGIELFETSTINGDTYTITFNEAVYGNADDNITAVIAAKPDYEIETITIGGEAQTTGQASYSVPVAADGTIASIVVTTVSTVVTPSVEASEPIFETEGDNYTASVILKPIGNCTEVGVKYFGFEFPAIDVANSNGFKAVKLVDDFPFITEIEAYYK